MCTQEPILAVNINNTFQFTATTLGKDRPPHLGKGGYSVSTSKLHSFLAGDYPLRMVWKLWELN